MENIKTLRFIYNILLLSFWTIEHGSRVECISLSQPSSHLLLREWNGFNTSRQSDIPNISSSNFIIDDGTVSDNGDVDIGAGGFNFRSLDLLRNTKTRAISGNMEKIIHLCQSRKNFEESWTSSSSDELKLPQFALVSFKVNQTVGFRFTEREPFCGSETEELSILNTNNSNNDNIGIMKNSYLRIQRNFYNTDEYCINRITKDQLGIKYCPPQGGSLRPIIPKCFPPDQIMSFSPRRAPIPSTPFEYSPKFYNDFPTEDIPSTFDLSQIRPHFIQHKPKASNRSLQWDFHCDDSVLHMLPFSEEAAEILTNFTGGNIGPLKFRVQVDGRVFRETLDYFNCPSLVELKPGKFCVDGVVKLGELEYTNTENEGIVFACGPPSKTAPAVSFAFGIIMILSSFFLLLTLIVYILLFHQQNIHGWTIMAHVTSMFFAYIFLGATHIVNTRFQTMINTSWCYINGVLAHFFFIATFFWLTLISFDLYWTFRSIVPAKKTNSPRMLIHILIGWGLPAIIVTVSICFDLVIGDDCSPFHLPKYGQESCYLAEGSQGVYIYYPILITLVLNLVFFCVTLYKLHHYKTSSHKAVKNNQNHRQLLELFTKLFFVMGVTWIFEFVSWLHQGAHPSWYWTVLDVVNILQAVAIFIIYVCKPDVVDSLQKKYPSLNTRIFHRFGQRGGSRGEGAEGQDTNVKGGGSSSGFADGVHDDKEKTRSSSLPTS